ncbi:DUF3108 domain-containing protein [Herbaspirillum sp. LeCh32-8]|uniref:DUF3108 domain-containing protein n=1 Tax=Herbaspirillum sp. LeCh32-8 TaxID=2821356 RepID=UPI001AE8A717|nr:DUF3108 domain-containing protein [Herbaspirillum sp. LeCh32-8]MBP0600094.1 DUF3108 domain-containing protein [Herbaspirillum sp. LeCh32-8]
MTTFFPARLPKPAAIAALALSGLVAAGLTHAADAAHPAEKRAFNLPPSADLNYSIDAKQSGLDVKGQGLVKWSNGKTSYSVNTETRAMLLGKILETSSEGAVDAYGLAPDRFVEKRLRRDPSTTTFNREQNKITFTQSSESFPLQGGEQDRTGITWQLVAVARANAAKMTPGSEWKFFVAGPRDAEQWTFKVVGREKISTPQGQTEAVHIFRNPPPDNQAQKLDIWLAPKMEWYPVRLKFTDPDGDYIEQTLDSVRKTN